jgi:hypothetical protein
MFQRIPFPIIDHRLLTTGHRLLIPIHCLPANRLPARARIGCQKGPNRDKTCQIGP